MVPSSNFPDGFANGLTIRGIPLNQTQTGQVFFVDNSAVIPPGCSSGQDGNPGTWQRPLATLQRAHDLCLAGAGDIIFVKAGHAETISAAAGLALSKSGVAIRGLGQGALRPSLTFDTATTASCVVTGANVSLENIVGITGINALSSPFHIQAANFYCNLEWQDPSDVLEAARAILTTAAADGMTVGLSYKGRTGGSSCVNAIRMVGVDGARLDVDFYGKASTSVVEFLTTACTNIRVNGWMYNSGGSGLRNVIDTQGSSTWWATLIDAATGTPYEGGSALALASSSISLGPLIATADTTGNSRAREVPGNKADTAVYTPGTTKSLMAYIKGLIDMMRKSATKAAATLTNGQVLFTVSGGSIRIISLISTCVTANDGTASTLQFSATPTIGAGAQTLSAASGSLASAAAGATVTLPGTALSTAALLNANGPNLTANPGTISVPAGTITAVVGVGSTTGTWKHELCYEPLVPGVTVA